MIQLVLYYFLALIVGLAALWSFRRPSASIGLFISMYATEQILLGRYQWAAGYGQAYNLGVGLVCTMAILSAVLKHGLPPIPARLGSLFFFLVFLVCASLLWTPAPYTASDWIRHFVIEGTLAFILPITTLRSREDFSAPLQVTIVIALVAATWTLAGPIGTGIGGRTTLIEAGTVLSPATLMGVALIALAVVDRSVLGVIGRFRLISISMLIGALYVSGARGQFLAAVALSAWVIVTGRMTRQASGLVGVIAVVLMSVGLAAAVILVDSELVKLPTEGRYSTESLKNGLEVRQEMLSSSLTLDRPIIGHGIGGWSFMRNGVDQIPKFLNPLQYPHNSLAQVYFELGVVGLFLFVGIVSRGFSNSRKIRRSAAGDPVLLSLTAMCVAYLGFEFLLSLKQGTFMAALGLYLSVSMLEALLQIHRAEAWRASGSTTSGNESKADLSTQASDIHEENGIGFPAT